MPWPPPVAVISVRGSPGGSRRPAPASRAALYGPDARALPSTLSRAVALASVWDMLVTAEASAAEAVNLVTGVLRVETSGSVIEPYLRLAADIAELWAPA